MRRNACAAGAQRIFCVNDAAQAALSGVRRRKVGRRGPSLTRKILCATTNRRLPTSVRQPITRHRNRAIRRTGPRPRPREIAKISVAGQKNQTQLPQLIEQRNAPARASARSRVGSPRTSPRNCQNQRRGPEKPDASTVTDRTSRRAPHPSTRTEPPFAPSKTPSSSSG